MWYFAVGVAVGALLIVALALLMLGGTLHAMRSFDYEEPY